MAADLQKWTGDLQTMSNIDAKNTAGGTESRQSVVEIADMITDERHEAEIRSTGHKRVGDDPSDRSVTENALSVSEVSGQGVGSVTDVSSLSLSACRQMTHTQTTTMTTTTLTPTDVRIKGVGDRLAGHTATHMDCAQPDSGKPAEPTINRTECDTSPTLTSDVKSQQRLVDVSKEQTPMVGNEARTSPDPASATTKSIANDAVSKCKKEELGESKTDATQEPPPKIKKQIDLIGEIVAPDVCSSMKTTTTTTITTTMEVHRTDVTEDNATTLPVASSPQPSVAIAPSIDHAVHLGGLRVALPDIEKTGKPDTAHTPEPTITAAIATDSGVTDSIDPATKKSVDISGASSSSSANSSKAESNSDPPESVYEVKWVQFKGQTTAIVTQNENGPCPLLAIMNCLLLQGRIKLPSMMEMVTSSQLMEYLGDCIFGNTPKNITEDALLNYEQNMQDAMDVFHKLQTGLDVNVKFTGVSDFEYTRECIVFDLLNIPLYHGWLVDPESPEVVAAVGNCSYNQLVEKIISQKNSNREELMTEALIAEEYLDRSAAQLTYHGLSELVTTVKEDELCVFFRNNHFSALYKHKKELFLLVTDQGFLTEPNVIWETLSNVEGDGHFVDTSFRTFRRPEVSMAPIAVPEVPLGTDMQIDQDYLVALSLQQEQQSDHPQAAPASNAQQWPQPAGPGLEPTLSDHELAIKLQEEEHRRAAVAGGPAQRSSHSEHRQSTSPHTGLQHQSSTASSSGGGGSRREKKSDCAIL